MSPDQIENALEDWGREPGPPQPPTEYLRLVRRERVRRRLRGLAVAAGLTLAVSGLVLVLEQQPGRVAPADRAGATAGWLRALNAGPGSELRMPDEPSPAGPALRVADRARPDLLDELLNGR